MPPAPAITVEQVDFGRFPVAAILNPRIRSADPLLRVTLRIRWDERRPAAALAHLEKALLSFSPSFRRHQCRGPADYHVFARNGQPRANPASHAPKFEGELALAHLLEHMVIDFECAVTNLKRCSGVTGALRKTPGVYHMFIETPERGVGRFCLSLALRTLRELFEGQPPGNTDREAILSARQAFHDPWRRLTAPSVARSLAFSEPTAERALSLLTDLGYLREESFALNFSGVRAYRVNGWGGKPPAEFPTAAKSA
jgi:hypothetical protein